MDEEINVQKGKRLAGVLILGGANLFIFGILFFLVSISAYFNATPKDLDAVKDILKQQNIQGMVTLSQFKTASIMQSIASLIFIASGWGIISKKEWGRKITVYFASFWAGAIFLTFILRPSFINYLFAQLIYPAILILYFTHKNVIKYFSETK